MGEAHCCVVGSALDERHLVVASDAVDFGSYGDLQEGSAALSLIELVPSAYGSMTAARGAVEGRARMPMSRPKGVP
jgi:hypothetical protein